MSGIYIPGIEMPKRCNECRFLEGDNMDGLCHAADRWMDDEDYWAWYVYEEDDIDTDKPANCPLIAIPDHGRLIDADALHKLFEDQWHYLQVLDWNENPTAEATQSGINWCINTMHDDAPTIIPAEEGE